MRNVEICCIGQTTQMLLRVQEMVGREPGMQVSSASGTFSDALRNLTVFKPDVAVIAVGDACPELKGVIEAIHRMAAGLPIIVLGGSTLLRVAAERAGIYCFINSGNDAAQLAGAKRDLITRIRLASATKNTTAIVKAHAPGNKAIFKTGFNGVLALGASCGGTEAIAEVVKMLPRNTPGMAIVQHMPAGFTNMYAQRLNRESAVNVVEAVGMHKIETGKILLAPGDTQMRVIRKGDGYYTECFNGQKVSGHKPSVDVLFSSVAKSAGKRAVGIILTGMGSDGAKGLLEMRRLGAYTIGQDERSSVVYGMPRVAYESGAVQKQVALKDVAPTLMRYLSTVR